MSEAEQAAAEYEVVQQKLQSLQQRLEQLEIGLSEMRRAEATIEALQTGQALVPIGAGFHIHADLKADQVVVPIGADQAASQSPDEALEALRARVAEAEAVMQRLMGQAQEAAGRLNELRQTLQSA